MQSTGPSGGQGEDSEEHPEARATLSRPGLQLGGTSHNFSPVCTMVVWEFSEEMVIKGGASAWHIVSTVNMPPLTIVISIIITNGAEFVDKALGTLGPSGG